MSERGAADFIVGIDLGTTHTVVAYAALGGGGGDGGGNEDTVRLFDIDQFVAPGEVAARPLLPSLRYHAAPGELPEREMQLTWSTDFASPALDPGGLGRVVIGRLARELGAKVPGRVVASAKSWLSHAAVDRTAAILPWGADDGVDKVSPVAASASYLAHVRAAWNARHASSPLERQTVVLTVPASFDESARAFTLEAARLAGLSTVKLLEEPQAALYDWLQAHRSDVAEALSSSRLALVCDVGGGTTDLSLIAVDASTDPPTLTRVGVCDHLMLGGDNMDLALALRLESRLAEPPRRLTAPQLAELTQQCRAAKERLLAADAPEAVTVTLLGAGARLVGGARSARLTRAEVNEALVDGFFPAVDADARPQRRRGGIVEWGLPYASDAAITRHVAGFLGLHVQACRDALGDPARDATGDSAREAAASAIPDTLLLNGGVFRAAALAERMVDVVTQWRGAPPTLLRSADLDAAVARGAVAYGLAMQGQALQGKGLQSKRLRIAGGTARSHWLVLGDQHSRRAVCLLPRGTEAGQDVTLADRSFALTLGRPVSFHLLSSTADALHAAGTVREFDEADIVRLPPLVAVIPAARGAPGGQVAVRLTASSTEVGTLALRCDSVDDPAQRWQLEFAVRRAPAATSSLPSEATAHPRLADATEAIRRVFGERAQAVDVKEVRQLRQRLESLLGERSAWDLGLLRALHATLWEGARRRRRSAAHERAWLNLAGYTLRPGFGSPLDAWRVEQMMSLYPQGLQHSGDSQCWSEWWTLWRRIAGGLTEDQQLQVLNDIAYDLQPRGAGLVPRPPGPAKGAYDDMVRLAASLERVGAEHKQTLGSWLIQRLTKSTENIQSWWAVGRIGAREPLSSSAHNVVPADVANGWVELLLTLDWRRVEPAAFAATQIARVSGDRARDLDEPLRERVARRLGESRVPERWPAMVRDRVTWDQAERGRVLGESLPPGLVLMD